MAFWNRKNKAEKTAVYANLPVLQGLNRLTASFVEIKNREQYANIFSTVSEVYAPIMYAAKAFSNMNVKLYTTDVRGGKRREIVSHDILTKLTQPNPFSNWRSFLLNYYVNKKVFGNAYVFRYTPSGFNNINDSAFWVLPSQYIYPVPVQVQNINTYYLTTEKSKLIKGYSFLLKYVENSTVNWTIDQILHTREPNIQLNTFYKNIFQELLEGRSPLTTLEKPITNIIKAYEAQNVILEKRGALGILSPKNAKDAVGVITLSQKEKEDLQKQFEQYGLGEDQWQYIITNIEMGWTPMSLPISELKLFEGIENSMIAICNTYNFPITLLNYLKGATFSNVNELKKSLYQDNIIPEAELFISELNSFLKLPEHKLILEANFDHIQVLQEDAKIEAEKDAIIVNTIISLQNQIKAGTMTIENAKAIMKIILSFSDEDIKQMFPENTQQNDTNTGIQNQEGTI